MAETSAGKDKPSAWTKLKHLIAGVAIVGGGSAAVEATLHPVETVAGSVTDAVVQRVEDIQHTGEQVTSINSPVYGKFLTRHPDGTFSIDKKPQVEEVEFTPHSDPTSKYWNGNSIVAHSKPTADFGEGQDIPVDQFKTTYAIRIAGDPFGGGQTKVDRFDIELDGKKYTIGEWFQPSDEQGNPVNIQGAPRFIAASFATVKHSASSETPTNQ